MSEETKSQESFQFRAEIQQLLNILVHSLYTEREIFIRELISNASDALNRIQFEMLTNQQVRDPQAELAIHIEADEKSRTIKIRDTGIGMTREEMIENLGTIAHSGVATLLKNLQSQEKPSLDLIGQFGVGFYSVFMVAEQVRVTSRSYRLDGEAYTWISDGGSSYQIIPAEKVDRGTVIEIKLKEEAAEFAQNWRLEEIVKRHSDFIAFPIYIEGKAANRRTAIWRQTPSEVSAEQYTEFYKHLTFDYEDPLLHVHMVTDAPVDIRALLYVPAHRERGTFGSAQEPGLQLYARRVLIQARFRDLLPAYLRFLEGVVESEDLPLNISRETVQLNASVRQIQRALTSRVLKELSSLAESKPEEYQNVWREFGVFIKEGVVNDPASKPDLAKLLRFHASKAPADALISLNDYVAQMRPEDKEIYYLLGEDLSSASHSPHLDYFRKHDIQVLLLTEPVDSFVVGALREFENKSLRSVDDPTLDLPQDDSDKIAQEIAPQAELQLLQGRFADVLGDKVSEIRPSRMLIDSPCRLVAPKEMRNREMQRVYKLVDRQYQAPKMVLEINPRHPMIRNLARLVTQKERLDLVDPLLEQLYENALLVEGLHPKPAEMIPRLQKLMDALSDSLK
jgi:molecular chaperone HtpG